MVTHWLTVCIIAGLWSHPVCPCVQDTCNSGRLLTDCLCHFRTGKPACVSMCTRHLRQWPLIDWPSVSLQDWEAALTACSVALPVQDAHDGGHTKQLSARSHLILRQHRPRLLWQGGQQRQRRLENLPVLGNQLWFLCRSDHQFFVLQYSLTLSTCSWVLQRKLKPLQPECRAIQGFFFLQLRVTENTYLYMLHLLPAILLFWFVPPASFNFISVPIFFQHK